MKTGIALKDTSWMVYKGHCLIPCLIGLVQRDVEGQHSPRSPSSALSHPFFGWEGSPTKTGRQKKVGTLIPTSQIWRT